MEAIGLAPGAFEQVETDGRRSECLWQHSQDPAIFAVLARVAPRSRLGIRPRPIDPDTTPTGSDDENRLSGRIGRDLRLLPLAVAELMGHLETNRYVHAHSMPFAAGSLRTFPVSQTLLQMVRGWARWRTKKERPELELSIYVTTPEVLNDLDSGRLDLTRGLSADDIEFWFEIFSQDRRIERFLLMENADLQLGDLLDKFSINSGDWQLELEPEPSLQWGKWTREGVSLWEKVSARESA